MRSWISCRAVAAVLAVGTLIAACSGGGTPQHATSTAQATAAPAEAVFSVATPHVPGTPTRYDKVQIRRYGNPGATRVLVLVPGTFGGAADFDVVGPYLASHVPNLQVWAEMRREGALEDNAMMLRGLAGTATPQQVFDYYIGWVSNPKISPHYQPLTNSSTAYAQQWGLATAMNDLHAVITQARDGGRRKVILGGHSLGGMEAAIYPAWDFSGQGGYRDLAGIMCIDGCASDPGTPVSLASAQASVAQLRTKGPWLDLLGIGLPWVAGALGEVSALAAYKQPSAPSVLQNFKLLPSYFKPAVPVTNEAGLGYGFDAATSPAFLALMHVHSGHLAATGNTRGWVNDGPTPIQNLAQAFSKEPLGALDWYYPARLTIDAGAARSLVQTPATKWLGLPITHLADVNLPLYAFQTSLGGQDNAVARGAHSYQARSKIPSVQVVSVLTYGHLDPLLAAPATNSFLRSAVPWLDRTLR
jgi:hypothetical protein